MKPSRVILLIALIGIVVVSTVYFLTKEDRPNSTVSQSIWGEPGVGLDQYKQQTYSEVNSRIDTPDRRNVLSVVAYVPIQRSPCFRVEPGQMRWMEQSVVLDVKDGRSGVASAFQNESTAPFLELPPDYLNDKVNWTDTMSYKENQLIAQRAQQQGFRFIRPEEAFNIPADLRVEFANRWLPQSYPPTELIVSQPGSPDDACDAHFSTDTWRSKQTQYVYPNAEQVVRRPGELIFVVAAPIDELAQYYLSRFPFLKRTVDDRSLGGRKTVFLNGYSYGKLEVRLYSETTKNDRTKVTIFIG